MSTAQIGLWQIKAHCLGGPMSKVGIYLGEKSGRPDLAEWFSAEMVRRMAQRCSSGVSLYARG